MNKESNIIGFGQPTGDTSNNEPVVVSHKSELEVALSNDTPATVLINGKIDAASIWCGSNKTILGINDNPTIVNGLLLNDKTRNVIIRDVNLTSSDLQSDYDGLSIKGGKNIWIDHCAFLDCADGSLDITKGADNITVSWCKFDYTHDHGHNFAVLIGGSDKDGSDIKRFHVTMHNNWWGKGCRERMPSNRFGLVHLFNNYFDCGPNASHCIRGRLFSETLIENNYFENAKTPWQYFGTPGQLEPKIYAKDNIFVNCKESEKRQNKSFFYPSYKYLPYLLTGEEIKSRVMREAGVRSDLLYF